VTRAQTIISSIGVLFKKGAVPRERVDVNELVREMVGMLRGEAKRHSIPCAPSSTRIFPTSWQSAFNCSRC